MSRQLIILKKKLFEDLLYAPLCSKTVEDIKTESSVAKEETEVWVRTSLYRAKEKPWGNCTGAEGLEEAAPEAHLY